MMFIQVTFFMFKSSCYKILATIAIFSSVGLITNSLLASDALAADKNIILAQRGCRTYRVASPTGLYVRVGGKIVRTLRPNTIVTVSRVSNSWALVSYHGGSGWVSRQYLTCYQQ